MNRTNNLKLNALIATLVLSACAGTASADTSALKRAASMKRYEAKLLACTSHCEARGEGEQALACRNNCEAHYNNAIAARNCEDDARTASSVHADALLREARSELASARMLSCLVRCEDSPSADSCTARCDQRYADETTRARDGIAWFTDVPLVQQSSTAGE